MTASVVFWLVVAVLLFWSLGAYNRLVRLRAQVIQAFAAVDQRMVRALELLAEATAVSVPAPTEPSEPSAAAGRTGLQAAAIQFEVALRVARKQPLDASGVAALQSAYTTAHVLWERDHPVDATADTSVAGMQRAWEDTTQLVRDAESGYNDAVGVYNVAIAQFPASILAHLFGFRPAAPL